MVLFAKLAQLAEALGATASRLAKRAAIVEALQEIGPAAGGDSARQRAGLFCQYLAGLPFSEADPRKLNAGGAILSRALKSVSGATDAALTAAYRRHGDMGSAAYDVLAPPYGKAPVDATVTLGDVAAAFDSMATARTTAARSEAVETLLRRCTALEAKYLLKLMLGDMRIGVKQSLVEEAIAVAAGADVSAVRHAVMLEADLSRAVVRAYEGTLAEARMTLFHPLGFMLASPVETPEEAVARFTAPPPKPAKKAAAKKPSRKRKKAAAEPGDESFPDLDAVDAVAPSNAGDDSYAEAVEAAAGAAPAPGAGQVLTGPLAFIEDKYDGMRVQLHCGDPAQPGRVALYSRNREDVTVSFPEIAEAFAHVREPLMLDGELLGWEPATDRALPFTILGQRIGRKRVDDEMRRAVPVVFMAFDLLFDRGELLLDRPLDERRLRLEARAAELTPGTAVPFAAPRDAGSQDTLFADADSADAAGADVPFLQRLRLSPSVAAVDAEQIERAYAEARARSNEGVMLKAACSLYLPGRRGLLWVKLKRQLATLDVVITGAEFGSGRKAPFLSDYTFAVRGDDGTLLNVGKAYSGVTDVEIAELTEWCKAHTLDDGGHFRTVEPQIVLEVTFNNIMRSDRHASGFALRFPRIVTIRRDKTVLDIDTLARVEEVYQSQPDKPREEGEASGASG